MNRGALLKVVEKKYTRTDIPQFKPGDTVRVNYKVVEGNRTRVQAYEGVVIKVKRNGFNSTFTVRKISFNEGVERIFPFNSPLIESVQVVSRGKVRRAKLYYLRELRGKAARIKGDRKRLNEDVEARAAAAKEAAEAKAAAKLEAEAAAQTSETESKE
jgi:large subunit ribosomal protein L19